MNEKDILLLLTHGALCGLGAKATLLSPFDMAKGAIDVARYALAELKAAGYTFEASDGNAPAPATPVNAGISPTVVSGTYDASTAPDPNGALSIAVTIRDSGNAIDSSAMSPIVQQFQQASGLKVDGVAGPKTKAAYQYWLVVASNQR